MNKSGLDKFFFVKVHFDNCDAHCAIYDASAVNYLWGPKSNSWGCYKKKYVDPKIVSKKQGVGWGSGYGLLQVNYCVISKVVSEVQGPAKYLKTHAQNVFKEYLRDFVKEKIYLIRKTGFLRISGLEPRFEQVNDKIFCSAQIGLCFTPEPFKDLIRLHYLDGGNLYPDWIIDSKRTRFNKGLSEHWFDKT